MSLQNININLPYLEDYVYTLEYRVPIVPEPYLRDGEACTLPTNIAQIILKQRADSRPISSDDIFSLLQGKPLNVINKDKDSTGTLTAEWTTFEVTNCKIRGVTVHNHRISADEIMNLRVEL